MNDEERNTLSSASMNYLKSTYGARIHKVGMTVVIVIKLIRDNKIIIRATLCDSFLEQ